jgi:hypothetical protein
MKILFRVGLLVIFLVSPQAGSAVTLSGTVRIQSVLVQDDLGIVRLAVTPSVPLGGCVAGTHVDIRLDAANRSATEQQVLLNLINLAFIGSRNVRIYLLEAADDSQHCSSVGTSTPLRVGVGIIVVD